MHRSRFALGFLLVPILFTLIVSTVGCGGSSEEPLVRNFFSAARSQDNTTLGNIATVSFDRRTDGTVETFSFVSETPETTEPLDLKAKVAAFQGAKTADEALAKQKNEYQKANLEAIARVVKAEEANKKVTGKDADVQRAWSKWREDQAVSSKKLSEARQQLASPQSKAAELSMFNAQKPIDVMEFDGVLATKEMTISAPVKSPDGTTSTKKQLVLTLQQARLKGADGAEMVGKWIVTGIKAAQ
jgi:hypothetical protein